MKNKRILFGVMLFSGLIAQAQFTTTNLPYTNANIGIGFATPPTLTEKLVLNGNFRFFGNANRTITMDEDQTYGTGGSITLKAGSSAYNSTVSGGNLYLSGGDANAIEDGTPSAGSVIINGGRSYWSLYSGIANSGNIILGNSYGNVGIGTATPVAKLHVAGASYLQGTLGVGTSSVPSGYVMAVTGKSSFSDNVGIGTTNAATKLHVVGQSYFQGTLGVGTSAIPSGYVVSVTGKSIFSDNVGIGTTNAAAKLHVTGQSYFDGTIALGGIVMPAGYVMSITGKSIFSDNMGIGTQSPTDRLDVNGNIALNGNIKGKNTSGSFAIFNNTDYTNGSFIELMGDNYSANNSNGNIRFIAGKGISGKKGDIIFAKQNGDVNNVISSNMTIKYDGTVLVGTSTSPVAGYLMYVKGKILSQGLRCDVNNWADDALMDGYKLMPLNDLKSYITKHHHLPLVPSEEEVKKDGIDVAEMNAVLLRKIEENTLYLLQIKAENDILKAEIEKLKK